MKKILFLILVLSLISGCGKQSKGDRKSDSVRNINIDLSSNPQKIELTDIYKNPSFIRLETNSSCLIKGNPNKVEIYKNRIYVYDSSNQGKLFCFDMQGKFLFQISERGNGPKEYVFLSDFVIDKENNCLWLGDDARKILKFDLDGNFIERYTTEFSINNLALLDEKENVMAIRLGYYKGKNYSFVIYSNKDKKILFNKSSSYINIIRSIGSNTFSQSRRNILYTEPFNDTVFTVTKSGMEPYCVVDFGKHAFPKKELENNQLANIVTLLLNPDNKYAGLISKAQETSKFLFFGYDFSGKSRVALHSFESDKTININEISFMGKSFEISKNFFLIQQDEKSISFLPPHLYAENETFPNENRQNYGSYSDIEELLPHLREDDNVILVIGELNVDGLF